MTVANNNPDISVKLLTFRALAKGTYKREDWIKALSLFSALAEGVQEALTALECQGLRLVLRDKIEKVPTTTLELAAVETAQKRMQALQASLKDLVFRLHNAQMKEK